MAKAKTRQKDVDISEIRECPDCGSMNIKHNEEKQQVICLDCGLIYEPLSPDLEQKFEVAHETAPKTRLEIGDLMPAPAPEKPAKAAVKKAKKKPARKAKAKPARKAVKKKPAKKKAAKPSKKMPPKKKAKGFSSILKRITRVKKRKKGSFVF